MIERRADVVCLSAGYSALGKVGKSAGFSSAGAGLLADGGFFLFSVDHRDMKWKI